MPFLTYSGIDDNNSSNDSDGPCPTVFERKGKCGSRVHDKCCGKKEGERSENRHRFRLFLNSVFSSLAVQIEM